MLCVRSWHVADVFTDKYSAWAAAQQYGQDGTDGSFDRLLYRFAIRCAHDWGP
jgi:hypothetical protein